MKERVATIDDIQLYISSEMIKAKNRYDYHRKKLEGHEVVYGIFDVNSIKNHAESAELHKEIYNILSEIQGNIGFPKYRFKRPNHEGYKMPIISELSEDMGYTEPETYIGSESYSIMHGRIDGHINELREKHEVWLKQKEQEDKSQWLTKWII